MRNESLLSPSLVSRQRCKRRDRALLSCCELCFSTVSLIYCYPSFACPHIVFVIKITTRDQHENLTGSIAATGKLRSQHHVKKSLPSTMQHNADGTVSIYSTNKLGARELYTQIPFTAIHGMQTRMGDQCDALGVYADNMNEAYCRDRRIKKNGTIVNRHRWGQDITMPLIIATTTTATLQFLVGYNIVILNTPEKYVFPGHSTGAWSLAVSALAVGAPFGAFFGGKLSADKGRRFTLFLNILIFLVGGIMQAFAPDLTFLTVARFILGIASGVATVLVPIYLGELAPPNLRGTLGTINQFAYVTGILVADLLSFRFVTEDLWRHLFLLSVFIPLIQLVLMPFVVESPIWLIQKNPEDPMAKQILLNLRGIQQMQAVDGELSTYIWAAKENAGVEGETQWQILMDVLSRSEDRTLFSCLFFLHTAQQLSGISAVFYYSTSLFEGIIDNPLIGTTLIGSVNVLFTYVALLLMDSCQRKSLILWSFGGMFLSCSMLILAQMNIFRNGTVLVAVSAYVAFFEIGVGPIPSLIIAEMFEARYVPVIMSIISQWSWVVNFAVSLVFPTVHNILGEYTFVPFAVSLLFSFFIARATMPETHGKTPAQVAANVKMSTDDEDGIESCYMQCKDGVLS